MVKTHCKVCGMSMLVHDDNKEPLCMSCVLWAMLFTVGVMFRTTAYAGTWQHE